ncbi:MAG: hypothetical protein IT440_15100 [Phycisphaeraceae bacterium]|nr:hypothetical protein [Phycisphaeraceae bacterium]
MNPNADNHEPRLSRQDAEAVDRLLGGESAPATTDPTATQRNRKLISMLGLLDRCAKPMPPADLVRQTLDRVRKLSHPWMLPDDSESQPWHGPGLKLVELLTVAAMVVVGLSLALPVMARLRGNARQVVCATNLGQAGVAFGQYAADNLGVMPRLDAEPGAAWYNVGQPQPRRGSVQSNSANLYLLAREKYLSPQTLACPDNTRAPRGMTASMTDWPSYDAVSYSYQNQYTSHAQRTEDLPGMAILADKNPLFAMVGRQRLLHLENLPQDSPTRFHHERGQNVLLGGGAVQWAVQPVVGNDNIWLAAGIDRYNGTETPTLRGDSFLVP